MELPRINYGRCNERPYRYAWGVGSADDGWLDRIVKADVDERQARRLARGGLLPGRAGLRRRARRARTRTRASCSRSCSTAARGNSFLLVLDAASLDELARAEVPHHIPFGFHGQFARA